MPTKPAAPLTPLQQAIRQRIDAFVANEQPFLASSSGLRNALNGLASECVDHQRAGRSQKFDLSDAIARNRFLNAFHAVYPAGSMESKKSFAAIERHRPASAHLMKPVHKVLMAAVRAVDDELFDSESEKYEKNGTQAAERYGKEGIKMDAYFEEKILDFCRDVESAVTASKHPRFKKQNLPGGSWEGQVTSPQRGGRGSGGRGES